MKRGWLLVACLCLLAATACWWRGLADAAFVVATLGVVAWFFNLRAQLRGKLPDEEETEADEDEDFDALAERDEQYRER